MRADYDATAPGWCFTLARRTHSTKPLWILAVFNIEVVRGLSSPNPADVLAALWFHGGPWCFSRLWRRWHEVGCRMGCYQRLSFALRWTVLRLRISEETNSSMGLVSMRQWATTQR